MSFINPSFDHVDRQNFYFNRKNEAIMTETPKQEHITTKEEILEKIDSFIKTSPDATTINWALLCSKTFSNKNDSIHYFNLFQTFFIQSLKNTHKDKDFSKLEDAFKIAKNELDNLLKDDKLENELFPKYLLGILRGLL